MGSLVVWTTLLLLVTIAFASGWRIQVPEQVPFDLKGEEFHNPPLEAYTTSDRVVILGRLSLENTTWVQENLADWQSVIYTADSSNTLSKQQGSAPLLHPQMIPYLTYLLTPSIATPSIAFVHPKRTRLIREWKPNFPDQNKKSKSLDLAELEVNAYAKLHCGSALKCRTGREAFETTPRIEYERESAMQEVWTEVLSRGDVMTTVKKLCCGKI
ncbi:hypothetical protein CC80DRAFT_543820 [Byssothecium circinans]|uniref:Uncharacterized protein n=1 Tax=Byssothecium circinans TaxID=147558 RepID=A0A6A5UCF1_9PLEO|nr:hypothetical protein CC80DRAFT_543820 [Byssothecium circinans]